MAPLTVGDPAHPHSPADDAAWADFAKTLERVKQSGVTSVSCDVWWGQAEPTEGAFDFSYFDRFLSAVEAAGLKWRPVLAFHACGGNVGDTISVPLPSWLGDKYASLNPAEGGDAAFSKSGQGNFNHEVLSPWATRAALQDYRAFMSLFQAHFSAHRESMAEVVVGLGPAGELRDPSYDAPDVGSGYSTRGALQAYSGLAEESFRKFVLQKYGSVGSAAEAWGAALGGEKDIRPPADANGFFARGDATSAYGKDFFDWYAGSLREHGREVLDAAVQVFDAPRAPFSGVELGPRIPGVHWRAGTDREAELTAGLLQTRDLPDWTSDAAGHGYAPIVRLVKAVGALPNAPEVALDYTALEMSNNEGGPDVGSQAKSRVFWLAREAARQGVPIEGENELAGRLSDRASWANIEDAVAWGGYQGVNPLRANNVAGNAVAEEGVRKLVHEIPGAGS